MKSNPDKADHVLYRVYHKLMLTDILYRLGFDSTPSNKKILHSFHKRVLGFKSTAGMTQEQLSKFLMEVILYWAERGIFVRSKRNQPIDILEMPLSDCWKFL